MRRTSSVQSCCSSPPSYALVATADWLHAHLYRHVRKEFRFVANKNLRALAIKKHPQALKETKMQNHAQVLRDVDHIGSGHSVNRFSNKFPAVIANKSAEQIRRFEALSLDVEENSVFFVEPRLSPTVSLMLSHQCRPPSGHARWHSSIVGLLSFKSQAPMGLTSLRPTGCSVFA